MSGRPVTNSQWRSRYDVSGSGLWPCFKTPKTRHNDNSQSMEAELTFIGPSNGFARGIWGIVALFVSVVISGDGFVWLKGKRVATNDTRLFDMGEILGLDHVNSVRFTKIPLGRSATFETVRQLVWVVRNLRRYGIPLPRTPPDTFPEMLQHLSVLSFRLHRHNAQRTLLYVGCCKWQGMPQVTHLVRRYSGPLHFDFAAKPLVVPCPRSTYSVFLRMAQKLQHYPVLMKLLATPLPLGEICTRMALIVSKQGSPAFTFDPPEDRLVCPHTLDFDELDNGTFKWTRMPKKRKRTIDDPLILDDEISDAHFKVLYKPLYEFFVELQRTEPHRPQ